MHKNFCKVLCSPIFGQALITQDYIDECDVIIVSISCGGAIQSAKFSYRTLEDATNVFDNISLEIIDNTLREIVKQVKRDLSQLIEIQQGKTQCQTQH